MGRRLDGAPNERRLDGAPNERREQQLLVDGAELHVEVRGEGLPLVLVHGLGLQAALWNRLCEALREFGGMLRAQRPPGLN